MEKIYAKKIQYDKIQQKVTKLKEIRKKLVFNNEDVFFYSALKGTGKEELTDFIFKRIERYKRNRQINEK